MKTQDPSQREPPCAPPSAALARPGEALPGHGLSRRNLLLGSAILSGALAAAAASVVSTAARAQARSGAQAPLRLAGRRCALIAIDLQVSNEHLPFQPHSFADVVRNVNVVAAAVRASGGLVVHTHVLLTEMSNPPADEPLPDAATVGDATQFATGAGPAPGDVVVAKRQWGAFYATDLDQQLRRRKIETLLIGGVATEFGVESTVRAAYDQGYDLVFVEDATSGAASASSDFFMSALFPHMGRVRSAAHVAAALSAT